MDLRPGQVVHWFSDIGVRRIAGERRPGVGALLRLDDGVVPDQRLVIFGDVDVEFECADPEFKRFSESLQRFTGRLAATTGVGLQVEFRRLRGDGRRRREHDDRNQHGAEAHD